MTRTSTNCASAAHARVGERQFEIVRDRTGQRQVAVAGDEFHGVRDPFTRGGIARPLSQRRRDGEGVKSTGRVSDIGLRLTSYGWRHTRKPFTNIFTSICLILIHLLATLLTISPTYARVGRG